MLGRQRANALREQINKMNKATPNPYEIKKTGRYENKIDFGQDILVGDLTEKQIKALDKILSMPIKNQRKLADIIERTAKIRGKEDVKITLKDAQIQPVLMTAPNNRFFLGDSPGLGKTIMSLGMYSYYMYRHIKRGEDYKKIIVITEGNHVKGFADEWSHFGVDLLPLMDGALKISRTLKKNSIDDFDGVILNWDGIKTNGFLDFYLRNSNLFDYIICDESSKILNPKNDLHIALDNIVNIYNGGLTNCVFLNGSSFEKNIYDYYYQFKILKPNLIPSKKYMDDRYVIKDGGVRYMYEINKENPAEKEVIKQHLGEIVGYKNQDSFRESIKYFYLARSKEDYSDSLPKHSYRLHGVPMTSKLYDIMEENSNISKINSPKTSDKDAKFTPKTHPKLEYIIEYAIMTKEDRPLIYIYNTEAQEIIKSLLEKEGFKVALLNGKVKTKEKNQTIDDFNNGKYDMCVFNLEKAMNIPTSDRILFYDIPTMPQRTNQIKGRIDRNNYTDKKFYDFFCYLDSPEMVNIVKLAYFREYHGNKFTGQYVEVYSELVDQLYKYYNTNSLDEVSDIVDELYEKADDDFESIHEEVELIIKNGKKRIKGYNRGK